MTRRQSSRETILELSDIPWHSAYPNRETFILLLFLILPALVCGCEILESSDSLSASPDDSAQISILYHSQRNCQIKTLDVFVFNNDRLERLDSYQRFENNTADEILCNIASCSGDKHFVFLANSGIDKYEWVDVSCLKSLYKRTFDLESENSDYPIMVGEYVTNAGSSFSTDISPLTAEIILRSIKSDFTGKSYADEKLTDVRVYLTNVNASCGINPSDEEAPSRIINFGMLNTDDMNGFIFPEQICQSLDYDIGRERRYPFVRLQAYPSCYNKESVGSPYTKLVIEGKINGNTYYYPIAINRNGFTDGFGIRRADSYIYDITITRTGLTDPDGVIEEKSIIIDMEISEWREKDQYSISF